ncbi:hypothetical protein NIES2109_21640 [Nostoc sp. HK-01]|nr:hypothetical protein NIES2109_21640 [Nostoc sp. HK-01]
MTHTPIEINGDCIDRLIKRLEKKIGLKEANKLKETAIEVVQNCVNVYSENFGVGDVGKNSKGIVGQLYKGQDPIPNGTTGLIYGRVQSGKTNTTIATLALAHENNFRCFIVLTSNNTWLGEQTANRFNNQIEGSPVIFDWEAWKEDPVNFAKTKITPYISDTGVVLVTTKNISHLKRLLIVLKTAKVKNFPTLIFDDEADNASLNTNESKQAKYGKDVVPDSSTFVHIGEIRQEVANHIYIQVTATPQSLLLQKLSHPCSPQFCAALPEPGESYMGGELFFTEESKYCCIVDAEEINELKKQKGENPGNQWIIPDGLRFALCCFFLGSTYKMLSSDKEDATYSFLAHICYKQDIHNVLEKVISQFVINLDQAIRDKSSATKNKQAIKWLEQAYNELNKTADNLPPCNELIDELKIQLRRAIPKIINANNPDKEPNYNPGMNILIGGNRLGRGVTIEGLMVTYYGRDAKQKVMDTVHQHARMYGYRSQLKYVTRLFLPEHILDAFRSIHEADEAMRQAIGDDIDNIQIQPVWVGGDIPTRANVLDPSLIGVLAPGKMIFPQIPAYKKEEIEESFQQIEPLLIDYDKDDQYYEVDIDFIIKIISYTKSHYITTEEWENKRIIKGLTDMKSNGMTKGRLNVRRGKRNNKEGLDMPRKEPFKWGGFGFGSGNWSIYAKKHYPDVPTLIICYQKGEKIKGWDDHPIYLPMLVLPKQKFVLMFNYAEDE